MNEELLFETQAAAVLSLSARTMQRYRVKGGGPAYQRLGVKRVGYRRCDLLAWLEGRSHTSTTAEGYVSPLAAKRRREAEDRLRGSSADREARA